MKNRCWLWFKHKVVHVKGFGYRCKWCGRTAQELRKDEENAKMDTGGRGLA
jgi:predicted SprT family Zn-dependent metalloprotease|nr:MAG TPA: hypothetical protein [Bacteriophage sp.]